MKTFNRLLLSSIMFFSGVCGQGCALQEPALVVEQMSQESRVSAQTLVDAHQSVNQLDVAALEGLPEGINMQAMQQLFATFAMRQEQKRQEVRARMFEKLPEETKLAVEEAKDRYQDVVVNCNLGDCLVTVLQKVAHLLRDEQLLFQGLFETQKYDQVVKAVDLLLQAVVNGSFDTLLPQNNLDLGGVAAMLVKPTDVGSLLKKLEQQSLRQQEQAFTLQQASQDRQLFVDLWNKLAVAKDAPKALAIRQEFYFLARVLNAVERHDTYELIEQCVARMRPDIDATSYLLDEAIVQLQTCAKKASLEKDKDLEKALRYWGTELRRYARCLRVFLSVEQHMHKASLSSDQFQKFFSLVANVYQHFGKEFIQLYKNDCLKESNHRYLSLFLRESGRNWWLATALDNALSMSLAAWFFSHTQNDFLTSFMQMIVVDKSADMSVLEGGGKGGAYAPDQMVNKFVMGNPLWLSYGMGGVAASPLLIFGPTAWSMQWSKPQKIASKVFVAFVYYNIFHNQLFATDKLWDAKDDGIRGAMNFSLQEGKKYIMEWIRSMHYRNPEAWKNIEQKTIGIVRPELLGAVIDACLPTLLLTTASVHSVADFTREDLYPRDYLRDIPQAQRETKGYAECDKRYMQQQMFFYIMESLGKHYGGQFARNNKSRLYQSAGKIFSRCFNGMVVRGWIDADTYESFVGLSDDFEISIDDLVGVLHEFLLDPSSKFRQLIVWQLKNLRFIDANEKDEAEINKGMVRIFLDLLAKGNLLEYDDAVAITLFFKIKQAENIGDKSFLPKREHIETTMVMIKEAIHKNVASFIGGKLGGWAMDGIALGAWKAYMWKYPLQ